MNKLIPLSLWGVMMLITPLQTSSAEIKKITINAQSSAKITPKIEKMHNEIENTVQNYIEQEKEETRSIEREETKNKENSFYTTRMTSYYTNDGYETGSCTGSGLCINDFQVNDKGWYTYQGKLVIATATTYLLKYGFSLADGVHTYKYYDELTLNIDGIDYQAIVLDSCGSSMKNGRIDLFVSNANSIKDTQIVVKE